MKMKTASFLHWSLDCKQWRAHRTGSLGPDILQLKRMINPTSTLKIKERRKQSYHLSKLVFEGQAGVPECCDHVRIEVYNENPDIDITAVWDDTALPEPACRGRERQREGHIIYRISYDDATGRDVTRTDTCDTFQL